jgi:hypothetical protein
MEQRTATSSDLVIAMTLAELFLLMLFIVWSGSVEGLQGDQLDWKSVAEERDHRIKEIEEELARQRTQIADLERRLAFWRTYFGVDAPRTVNELIAILQGPKGKPIIEAAGRGFARCEENNALVHVYVVNGTVRMEIISNSARLHQWGQGRHVGISAGDTLIDWLAVRNYVGVIRQFYDAQAVPCRFDYQMTYGTKEDYYDARVELESAFYPGRITRTR